MTFTQASFDTYKSLRDMDISHPDIEGSWRLGQMTSWARWGKTTGDLSSITARSEGEFNQLQPFTTRVILFAINLGGTTMKAELEDWRNFHSGGHRPDGTLKNSIALAKDGLEGASDIPALYMSDVFKLVPTGTAGDLATKIREDRAQGIDHVERCAAILREELKICVEGCGGQAPALVAMGSAAFCWLTGEGKDTRIAQVVDEVLGDGASKRVTKMDHYANGRGSNAIRAAALRPVLEGILNAG